jgi:purine-binding chemotaxis protein CheW
MAERFLTFRVGGELYALPANQIAEVIRLPAVARVPQAPKGLLGLANLRGSVLPVASVRGLIGAEESAEATTRAIVLDGAAPVALAVDVVEALVAVETEQIETRQAELATRPGERLKGAFAADGRNAIAKILDIEGLIGAAFVAEARARPRRALAAAAGQEAETASDDREMLVSFDVAGQEYALTLNVVQEILDTPKSLAALPASESLVLGVTPFRDTLLPLLSLRGLLGFTTRAERADREKIVVARVGGALVGLLADRMRGIFPADADLMEKIPPVLSARAGGEAKISAIYRGESGRRLVSVLAPEQLFREDVMQRLKASGGSAGEGDRETPKSQREERQFLVFRLGGDEFGLPIEAVDEVARVPEQITRLPRTPKFLEGVVNLRGEVLPVVDQRRRFDMPALDERTARRLVVVRTERHKAGLIVDSVSEVLRCPTDEIEPAPNLSNETVKLVHGVVNLEQAGRIVLLLDPAELLTRAERGLLDTFRAKAERAVL